MREQGLFRRGHVTSGTMVWTDNPGSKWPVKFRLDLTYPQHGLLSLQFAINGAVLEQRITLKASPCALGGSRYFFLCPVTGERVLKLSFIERRFQSRKAAKLTYRSQGEDRLSRLIRAHDKVHARAFGIDGLPRPRGQNRVRLESQWHRTEAKLEDATAVLVEAWRSDARS